jgi:hypothetical protein
MDFKSVGCENVNWVHLPQESYQIKGDEVGKACSMRGSDEKCIRNFSQKT